MTEMKIEAWIEASLNDSDRVGDTDNEDESSSRAEAWVQNLEQHVSLTEAMRDTVRRQAKWSNWMKPVGLFRGDQELVTRVDPGFYEEHKSELRSFAESIYTCGFDYPDDPVSCSHLIEMTALLIEASAIERPRADETLGDVKQDVKDVFDSLRI